MAIYGGIIGAVITAIVFCHKRKVVFLDLIDFLIPYLALGQAIGRWGNFVNQEAYGYMTDSFLKMRIFDESLGMFVDVHPTFLYESLLDFFIFILFTFLRKRRQFLGQLLYIYMILYGSGRAFIEGLRTDSLMFGNFRVSQVLSIIFVLMGCILYGHVEYCRRKGKNVD